MCREGGGRGGRGEGGGEDVGVGTYVHNYVSNFAACSLLSAPPAANINTNATILCPDSTICFSPGSACDGQVDCPIADFDENPFACGKYSII